MTKTNTLRKHAYSNILEILPTKSEKSQIKNSDIFQASAQNIDYKNTPIQIHWKIYQQKKKMKKKFRQKNSDIFQVSALNIDCGYLLEPPRRGGSNEYPQSMFWVELRIYGIPL